MTLRSLIVLYINAFFPQIYLHYPIILHFYRGRYNLKFHWYITFHGYRRKCNTIFMIFFFIYSLLWTYQTIEHFCTKNELGKLLNIYNLVMTQHKNVICYYFKFGRDNDRIVWKTILKWNPIHSSIDKYWINLFG